MIDFDFDLLVILVPKINQYLLNESIENSSKKGIEIGMHLGIAFGPLCVDFWAHVGIESRPKTDPELIKTKQIKVVELFWGSFLALNEGHSYLLLGSHERKTIKQELIGHECAFGLSYEADNLGIKSYVQNASCGAIRTD